MKSFSYRREFWNQVKKEKKKKKNNRDGAGERRPPGMF